MTEPLTVILPTLNEAGSIRATVTKVIEVLKNNHIDGQVLVVDDNSTDETHTILIDLQAIYTKSLNVVIRYTDHGLSNSLVDGFKHATTEIVMVMDSDGQHPIEKIPELYQAILDGNDIALGSRYMGIPGSGFAGLAYHRRLISWGATLLSRFFFPTVTDSGSGFFAFRKEVIKYAPLKPQGFRMLFEILGKGNWKTAKEVPIIFGTRKNGESKLTTKTVVAYLKQLWGLFTYSLTHSDSHGHAELKRLVTFTSVGLSGICVYLITIYLLTDLEGIIYVWSGFIGVELSILSNFVLNDIITFKGEVKKHTRLTRLGLYHLVSLGGTIITMTIMITLTEWFGVWYILSSLIGIVTAFLWNFTFNRGVTWGSN